MLYLSFLKRLTPILAVNMVKRLQEVIGTGRVINWSAEQPFRHNLLHVLTALCAYLKENNYQFVKTLKEADVLFYLEVNDQQPYFLEIFNEDNFGFQEFLMKPRNLELIKDNPHLTLNLQKLLIELYFFVNLEKKLNEVLESKRQEYLQKLVVSSSLDETVRTEVAPSVDSDEFVLTAEKSLVISIKSDEALHAELLLMAANLRAFATKMAYKKNYSDAGLTADVFDDFQRFITQLNQAIVGNIQTGDAAVAPLADMQYEQVFFDPLFALGTALLDYILSKSIQGSPVDYSAPQSMLALPSSAAHFLRMAQSLVAGTVKVVTSKTLSTDKIELNQTAIWNMIEYYYRQFLSRKSSDFRANFDTASREVKTAKQDFESNRGVWAVVKAVVKGNDFPRVLEAAQAWLEVMRVNVASPDKAWCGNLDFAYFESGHPPSRELGTTKYKMSPLAPEHLESEASPDNPEARRSVTPPRRTTTPQKLMQQPHGYAAEDVEEQQEDLADSASPVPVRRAETQSTPGSVRKPALSVNAVHAAQQRPSLSSESADEREPEDLEPEQQAVDDVSAANDETTGALHASAPPITLQHERSTSSKGAASKVTLEPAASAQGKQDQSKKKKHK